MSGDYITRDMDLAAVEMAKIVCKQKGWPVTDENVDKLARLALGGRRWQSRAKQQEEK